MVVTIAASPDLVDALAIAVEERLEICHESDPTLLRDRYSTRHILAVIIDFRGIDNPNPRIVDEAIRARACESIIAVVDRRQVALAIEVTQRGAHDCLPAPVSAIQLRRTLRRALARGIAEDSEDSVYNRVPVGPDNARRVLSSIRGSSHAMRRLRFACSRAACSSAPVLIQGETGSGKERVARAIHDLSIAESGPYVCANVCAIPTTIFDAQMFGVRKGAYTDAIASSGLFAHASGGSLFLDEIGDLELPLQAKMLRAVEYMCYLPVGAAKEETAVVRIISATNRDLHQAVEQRQFRRDLFDRLSILAILVPPLREHPEDIPETVEQILHELDRQDIVFDGNALASLQERRWEGNYRELRSVVERTLVSSDRKIIRVRDVRFDPFL